MWVPRSCGHQLSYATPQQERMDTRIIVKKGSHPSVELTKSKHAPATQLVQDGESAAANGDHDRTQDSSKSASPVVTDSNEDTKEDDETHGISLANDHFLSIEIFLEDSIAPYLQTTEPPPTVPRDSQRGVAHSTTRQLSGDRRDLSSCQTGHPREGYNISILSLQETHATSSTLNNFFTTNSTHHNRFERTIVVLFPTVLVLPSHAYQYSTALASFSSASIIAGTNSHHLISYHFTLLPTLRAADTNFSQHFNNHHLRPRPTIYRGACHHRRLNYSYQRPNYQGNAPIEWHHMLQHQFVNCINPDPSSAPLPMFR
ncbi:hypothetical protein BDB00DRAFT_880517 [Zychaea mexicana]|uniref:uncharacterized protein n=1 Tax=Zychaea mexicana TaxID=64656 RepID=UPI0022FF3A83|nr:uncharacterized protein BDB00DRAFT_880517 [Zychaea mexicana]KAI9467609.1 hypothetical protein BDB00DRAFT_880517 [Zychaea mexicana]